jgi:hypothetical protein
VLTPPSGRTERVTRDLPRVIAELVIAAIGITFVGWAVVANQQWFDRHFLPAFFVSRQMYSQIEMIGRAAALVLGLLLLFIARPFVGRLVARHASMVFSTLAAIVLAFAASEVILSQLHAHAAGEEPAGQEPRRRLDARLGWTFVPSRAADHVESGRQIEYAFDAHGYRVRSLSEPVDFERPSILFTGESMMVGEGLTWDESVPARVGAALGVQAANLAVSAYATDQAYLRLLTELPRFQHPLAIVTLFTPAIFDRNMDDDRPHLGPGLVWQPAVTRWRMLDILRLLVRYRKVETIDRGVAVTRDVFRATIALAHAHRATPLIVVPQFGPEEPAGRALRARILDDPDFPVVRVELDGSWRIPGDRHPDARAAQAIASAIVARLREGVDGVDRVDRVDRVDWVDGAGGVEGTKR